MDRDRVRVRAGHSLLEMIVSLVLGAIIVSGVGAIGFRQQRFHRDVIAATERLEQLDQTTALIPIALRSIAPGANDIPAGGARDTSLEFRATIATAVVCDTAHGIVVIAPAQTGAPHLASMLTHPVVGDTIWSLALSDSTESWIPQPIAGTSDSMTACLLGGASPWGDAARRSAVVLRVAAPLPAGTPIRVTRPWRYSLYRSSDGDWYLGARDWNSTTMRFNTIQPVSGPLLSAASRGLTFQYEDSTGAAIQSGATDTHAIAFIRVAIRVDTVLPGKFTHAVGVQGRTIVSVALRNRAR